jgi:uncharacterized membrane protein
MSRKTIIAILGVVLVFLKEQFGLALDVTAFLGVVLYLLFESKLDARRIISQAGRFKDPKFWIALVTAILPVLNAEFGWNLPIEAIVSVLSVLLAVIFGVAIHKS